MLTYNQKEFIGQAIEAVLEQRGNFSYELVIGDDGSTDGTLEICKYYKERYKNKIKLLSSNRNLGLIQNFIRTYKECKGKYVAICDGDDYWIDPYKLQKQVSFLEENPDFSIVFTGFNFLFPNNEMTVKDYSGIKEVSNFEDLIKENYISSVTALFRNKKTAKDFPNWLGELPYGDWPLYLWTTKNGSKIKFISHETSVYRREIGVSEKMKKKPYQIAKVNLLIIKNVLKDKNFQNHKKSILKSLKKHELNFLIQIMRGKKTTKYFGYCLKIYLKYPLNSTRLILYLIKNKISKRHA